MSDFENSNAACLENSSSRKRNIIWMPAAPYCKIILEEAMTVELAERPCGRLALSLEMKLRKYGCDTWLFILCYSL